MLGQRISELRQAANWTQVDLAKRLNISKQAVSNWENDNIMPSIEMLVRLSELFGVTTDYLLSLDNRLQLNVDGLPISFVAHLNLLIDDFRNNRDLSSCEEASGLANGSLREGAGTAKP